MNRPIPARIFGNAVLVLWFLGGVVPCFSGNDDLEQVKKAISRNNARWEARESWVTQLTAEERRALCGAERPPAGLFPKTLLSLLKTADLPSALDWRNNNGNWVTPVRDQGLCGSCWDLCAIAQVESWWKIHNVDQDSMIDLSEQFILSCAGVGSCEGGTVEETLDFIRTVGVPSEECFTYEALDTIPCDNACPWWESEVTTIPGWGYVTLNENLVENIKQAIYRHPVSARFDVYTDFMYYGGGVYRHVWGGYEAPHAVLIIGWDDLEQSWICKNSWGPWWGESGYFRIEWGQCGMGAFVTSIWNETVGPDGISVSPDQLAFDLAVGDSASAQIVVSNQSAGTLEFSGIDYQVPILFHPDDYLSYDGMSWWCGDPRIGGYRDSTLQFLYTPVFDLGGTSQPVLEFKASFAVEDPAGAEPPYDGWDGCNVWISTDSGATFGVLVPDNPPYTCQSLWSFGDTDQGWNYGPGIPGWAGNSGGWFSVTADLSSYQTSTVVIRFAFASDMAYCTLDDPSLNGYFVDEIRVSDGSAVIFENDADPAGSMQPSGKGTENAEWISLSEAGGSIPPGGSKVVDMVLRTEGMNPGEYHGLILVLSNDTINPELKIPVLLRLSEGTGVDSDDRSGQKPESEGLSPNYPNPFNASTMIPYRVSEPGQVVITVCNDLGKPVRSLVRRIHEAGSFHVVWDGTDDDRKALPSGMYLVRLDVGRLVQTRKVLLVR